MRLSTAARVFLMRLIRAYSVRWHLHSDWAVSVLYWAAGIQSRCSAAKRARRARCSRRKTEGDARRRCLAVPIISRFAPSRELQMLMKARRALDEQTRKRRAVNGDQILPSSVFDGACPVVSYSSRDTSAKQCAI
eukprot:IDg18669t1